MTSAGPAPSWCAAARRGGPDGGEDSGADDGADAERDQLHRTERPLHLVLGLLRVGEDQVERLLPEELAHAKVRRRISEGGRRAGDPLRQLRQARDPVGDVRRARPGGRAAAPAAPRRARPRSRRAASRRRGGSLRRARRRARRSGGRSPRRACPSPRSPRRTTRPEVPREAAALEELRQVRVPVRDDRERRIRAPRARSRAGGRPGRRPTTPGSRKCRARRANASSDSGPPSSSRRTRPRKVAPELGLAPHSSVAVARLLALDLDPGRGQRAAQLRAA